MLARPTGQEKEPTEVIVRAAVSLMVDSTHVSPLIFNLINDCDNWLV